MKRRNFFLFFLYSFLLISKGGAEENYLLSGKIQEGNVKKEAFGREVKEGSFMAINYKHSLYHSWQKEVYVIQDGIFKLREIYFGKLEAACYYDVYHSGIFFNDDNLWKFLPAKSYSFSKLKIRIPLGGDFSIVLDNSFIWLPGEEHRGKLLILAIIP